MSDSVNGGFSVLKQLTRIEKLIKEAAVALAIRDAVESDLLDYEAALDYATMFTGWGKEVAKTRENIMYDFVKNSDDE